MRALAKTAAVLVGLGIGVVIGPSLGSASTWCGAAIAALGVVFSLVGRKKPDLAGDGPAGDGAAVDPVGGASTTESAVVPQRQRRSGQQTSLSSLGGRVEQILALTEEQASRYRAEARSEAEAILAAARREAQVIVGRARDDAEKTSGGGRDPAR